MILGYLFMFVGLLIIVCAALRSHEEDQETLPEIEVLHD